MNYVLIRKRRGSNLKLFKFKFNEILEVKWAVKKQMNQELITIVLFQHFLNKKNFTAF